MLLSSSNLSTLNTPSSSTNSRFSSRPRLKPLKLVKQKVYPLSPLSTTSLSSDLGTVMLSSPSTSEAGFSTVTLKTDTSSEKKKIKKHSNKAQLYEYLSSENYDDSIYSKTILDQINLSSTSSLLTSYSTSDIEDELEEEETSSITTVITEPSTETVESSSSSSKKSENKSSGTSFFFFFS